MVNVIDKVGIGLGVRNGGGIDFKREIGGVSKEVFPFATIVISTKWKHLFASTPNLSLEIDNATVSNPQPNTNFVDSIYHLLTVTLRDVGLTNSSSVAITTTEMPKLTLGFPPY